MIALFVSLLFRVFSFPIVSLRSETKVNCRPNMHVCVVQCESALSHLPLELSRDNSNGVDKPSWQANHIA